jgi:hypothetical protein
MPLIRKLGAAIVAVALILPPAENWITQLFGGSGHHQHVEHIWHTVDVEFSGLAHDHDAAGDQHCDHFHIAVMAFVTSGFFDITPPARTFETRPATTLSGFDQPPLDRPPRRLA